MSLRHGACSIQVDVRYGDDFCATKLSEVLEIDPTDIPNPYNPNSYRLHFTSLQAVVGLKPPQRRLAELFSKAGKKPSALGLQLTC